MCVDRYSSVDQLERTWLSEASATWRCCCLLAVRSIVGFLAFWSPGTDSFRNMVAAASHWCIRESSDRVGP